MKCIVIGGRGFIGRHVVSALRKAQHDVTVVDLIDGDESIDICDAEALLDKFQAVRPQYIFHLAAVADPRATLNNPVKTVIVNVAGTASVLDAARRCAVRRVILASTCWVANAMAPGVLDETTPFQPGGGGHVYTTTKMAAELLAHDFHKLWGLPFTILRYGIPYGPGMWSGLVLRNFLDQAFANQPLIIFGDGSAARRFVYVDDLALAHVLALQDIAANQVYNLEGRRLVTIKELAELVSRMLGGVAIIYREEPSRVGEFRYDGKYITSDKAYRDLGWAPTTDIEAGVRQTIDWYKSDMLGGMPHKAGI